MRQKQERTKKRGKAIMWGAILLIVISLAVWFWCHPTSYRYNDRWILGKGREQIQAKYGDFDQIDGNGKRAGYYLDKDNGPIMPSHLPVYYWIDFDESGKAVKISKGGPMGG